VIRVRAALMIYCDLCGFEHFFSGEVPSINITALQRSHTCYEPESVQEEVAV
jgi:hypothetical protein